MQLEREGIFMEDTAWWVYWIIDVTVIYMLMWVFNFFIFLDKNLKSVPIKVGLTKLEINK